MKTIARKRRADDPRAKIVPGPCGCECAGCDQMGMHCMKADRGCGYRRVP
ncbi:hypothetical protein [Phycicoccus sp. Root101]|nr:hypothetical protein [Phycicoccus sp. Root101]